MSKAIRATLSLAAGLVLVSALAMGQASGNTTKKATTGKNTQAQQHSKLSKAAFWRHQKNNSNSKKTPAKGSSQKAATKKAQAKAASTKVASKKTNQKHTSKLNKSSAKKTSTAKQTKTPQKAQSPQPVSLKQ
jgi:hypothetical protein